MSLRYRASQLFTRRWPVSHVPLRTFANGNVTYNQVYPESINEGVHEPTVNDSPTPPRRTGELERRARILQTWQDQLENAQLDEYGENDDGANETQPLEPRNTTRLPPIWLPERPMVRKVKIDATAPAITGAIRYYLQPRRGNARMKAEQAAAADPMLQYALSPEHIAYRGDSLDVLLDEAFQIGKGNSVRDVPQRRRSDSRDGSVDEQREARRRQAEENRKKDVQRNGLRRPSQMQHTSLSFAAAFARWRNIHSPQVNHGIYRRTHRSLLKIATDWVDSLSPKFTKQQIYDFADEVAVLKRVIAQRHHRELQQSHPRLHLQNLMLNSCINIENHFKESLHLLDRLLQDTSFQESAVGKDCEVFAQKIDFWLVQYAAMSEDFIQRMARYLENLSDEEVARKLETFNARAASREGPYFDPARYSGTIDPVFWPRGPRLGI